jgi:hypothetical protein
MKTLNEEMKKIKRLFDYKNGEVITESEDKECDCGNEPCTCVEEGHYIGEDSEGEETFNYGEDEGEDHKEEEHLEGEEDMAPHDRIKEIKKHLEAQLLKMICLMMKIMKTEMKRVQISLKVKNIVKY